MKAHILVAPFAFFGVGLLLRRHALARVAQRRARTAGATGVAMLWLFLPLALTGYLIQVLVGPGRARADGLDARRPGRSSSCSRYAFHPKRRAAADTGTDESEPRGPAQNTYVNPAL